MPKVDATPLERFHSKIEHAESGCWLWTGALNRHGYGKGLSINGVQKEAHRFAYELLVGPIPKGLEIDHLCRVRHCVNPAHLEAVTHAENVRRAAPRVYVPPAEPRVYTPRGFSPSCRRGHVRTEANTYLWITPEGREQRHCLDCKALNRREAA